MKKMLMTIFARTPIHVGAGNSVGAIDSPIMRERHTRIPLLPGSSIKGVLADLWEDGRGEDSDGRKLFGSDDPKNARAGRLLIGEGRLVAFPVRSSKGSFAWLTCPLVLHRFARDSGRPCEEIPELEGMECEACNNVTNEQNVILEEYLLKRKNIPDESILSGLQEICSDPVWCAIKEKLVIVSDELFSYFVENTCEVVTRIRIDGDTGTVAQGALFNQEQVPSESLFYSVIAVKEEDEECLEKLKTRLQETGNIIQIGGDETIGLGFCSVELIPYKEM